MDSVILKLFLQHAHDHYLGAVCLFSVITFNITNEHFTESIAEDSYSSHHSNISAATSNFSRVKHSRWIKYFVFLHVQAVQHK